MSRRIQIEEVDDAAAKPAPSSAAAAAPAGDESAAASPAVTAAVAPADDFVNPLTKEKVVKSCVDNGFYRTPHCNEKLYLHHRAYDHIGDALKEYTAARVLWFEGNALREVEGLDTLSDLRQLYLHLNSLRTLGGGGLAALTQLDCLNVSDNNLTGLEGLEAQYKCLATLQAKNNRIVDVSALEPLTQFEKLTALDIQGNKITDGDALLELLQRVPNLKSLWLSGNPCVRSIKDYRRNVISILPNLVHLDERPVFADERRTVTAWAKGGLAAEKEERKKMRAEEDAAHTKKLEDFRKFLRKDHPEAADGPTEEDTDSTPTSDDDDDDGSGSVRGEPAAAEVVVKGAGDEPISAADVVDNKKGRAASPKASAGGAAAAPHPASFEAVTAEEDEEVWVPK